MAAKQGVIRKFRAQNSNAKYVLKYVYSKGITGKNGILTYSTQLSKKITTKKYSYK